MELPHILMGLCIGIGLSAACGFRVFIPLLSMAIGARWGHLTPSPGFEWVTSDGAILALGVATTAEVAAFYIPWFDHLMDTIATPAALVAGTLATAAVLPDMGPMVKWGLATVAGGGTAGAVQVATVTTRALSTATTGGLGNPIVATGENGGAVVMSIMAIVIPIIAAILVCVVLFFAIRAIVRWWRRRSAARVEAMVVTVANNDTPPNGRM
ncbi:MAG: DUF4126 family protein [Planctomycetes bacterium]|nr:DUF4126 family protein [Planctomycetota bacterium]